MALNFGRFISQRLGVAIDWRVRDVLEAEREATVQLGNQFLDATASLTDRQRLLEQRVELLEEKIIALTEKQM